MKKELDKKTYAISDLKAIHVAQGEVIRNMRKERDGLKNEMQLVKNELQDLKKENIS